MGTEKLGGRADKKQADMGEGNNSPSSEKPFDSPLEMLDSYGTIFKYLCARELYVSAESLINDYGAYDPGAVSLNEVFESLAGKPSEEAREWLKGLKIPSLDHINDTLIMLVENMTKRILSTLESSPDSDGISMPLVSLRENFQLSELEFYIIIGCALIQYKEIYGRACRYLTGAAEGTQTTAGFLLHLFNFLADSPQEVETCLLPDNTLMRYGLVRLKTNPNWGSDTPLIYSAISIPSRLLSFILGDKDVLGYVPMGCRILDETDDSTTSGVDKAIQKTIQKGLQRPSAHLGLMGYKGVGRTNTLVMLSRNMNMPVLLLDLNELFAVVVQGGVSLDERLSAILLEIRLRRAVLLVDFDTCETELENWLTSHAYIFRRYFYHEPYLRYCVLLPRQNTLSRALFGELSEVKFPPPSKDDQPKFWLKALTPALGKKEAAGVAEIMAGGYCLSYNEVVSTIDQTLSRLNSLTVTRALTPENLSDTLNKTRGQKLEGMATLRSTTLYLKDIVLSEDKRKVLKEVLSYARHRDTVMLDWGFAKYNQSGAGLSVLLSGVPGTGKTLTALVLAHELGRALYVVDLSRVVDKYIGETEKKLSVIFDEAERSQAMLLFDEADSLFSKRTNVKSSNDRYANLEVNYLLQRLEAYSGVSILTTNFGGGLDEALERRIQFKLDFPMPDENLRTELWRKLIPPGAPCSDDIDLEAIASSFEMSGGHIKNAIFRASIQALDQNRLIDHELLWDAAVHEYRSMGHIIRDGGDEE